MSYPDLRQHAILKSTGESVHILGKVSIETAKDPKSDVKDYFDCMLPPQSPGHSCRRVNIRKEKLSFPKQ